MLLSLFIVATCSCVSASSVVLTPENFDQVTKGKTVFIKFFAPWCDHCKALAPAWDQMASEWPSTSSHDSDDSSAVGFVGEVDCAAHQRFCQVEQHIEGLPTLRYGEPSGQGIFLEEYNGDKTYEDLSQFANTTLNKRTCSPLHLEPCDELTKNRFLYLLSLSVYDLERVVGDYERKMAGVEQHFRDSFDAMQADYDRTSSSHQMFQSQVKTKVKMVKSVLEWKASDTASSSS